jgi:sugar lactone lactonase YvrE
VPASTVEPISPVRCHVGESPLWSVAEQALYWVDIEGRLVHRWPGAAGVAQQWTMPERPACIALHAQGGLLCALESCVVQLTLAPDGSCSTHDLFSFTHASAGMRLNDGRCDRAGRFWVGSMLMNMAQGAPSGVLYRCDAGASAAVPLQHGLIVPNGLAFSPDGRTAYLSDSHASVRHIWAFDLRDDGSLSQRRLFVDMALHRGRPDGAAVDVDGCYWTCANDGACLLRFTPAGVLDRTLEMPVKKPSMCAFGGARLDELYITSIRPPTAAAEQHEDALAGATFVCRPGVQGLAETAFAPPRAVPGGSRRI